MIPDRNAEPGQHPHDKRYAHFCPTDGVDEQQGDRNQRPEERQHIEDQEVLLLDAMKVGIIDDLAAPATSRIIGCE